MEIEIFSLFSMNSPSLLSQVHGLFNCCYTCTMVLVYVGFQAWQFGVGLLGGSSAEKSSQHSLVAYCSCPGPGPCRIPPSLCRPCSGSRGDETPASTTNVVLSAQSLSLRSLGCCRCTSVGAGHHAVLTLCGLIGCGFSIMDSICCKDKFLWQKLCLFVDIRISIQNVVGNYAQLVKCSDLPDQTFYPAVPSTAQSELFYSFCLLALK